MMQFRTVKYNGKRKTVKHSNELGRTPRPASKYPGNSFLCTTRRKSESPKNQKIWLETWWEDLYLNEKMSCPQIAEETEKKYGTTYTPRWIHMVLSERRITRTQSQSMKVRVETGRMDYSKRYIDYEKRDYINRTEKRYKNWKYAVGLEKLIKKRKVSFSFLAKKLKVGPSTVRLWVGCDSRVEPKYQIQMCKILHVKKPEIFSNIKQKGRVYYKPSDYYYAPTLKKEIDGQGIGITEFAFKCGIPPNTLKGIVCKKSAISSKTRRKLLKYLGLNHQALFTKELIKNKKASRVNT